MEIRCQIKHRFWKIHELETFGIRKRILRKKSVGCSTARKRPVLFLTFHTFPCIFSRELFFSSSLRLVRYTDKCMENSKHDWTLSGTATSLQSFFLKCFSQCQKFPIHEFFRSDVLWKLFDIGFPYKHCFELLFQACWPTRQNGVENRDEAYCKRTFVKTELKWLDCRHVPCSS